MTTNLKRALTTPCLVLVGLFASPLVSADDLAVRITEEMSAVQVKHQGQLVTIQRNQDQDNQINPAFTRTSRRCPPFCVQPMSLGNGVQTYGELEVIDALKRITDGDQSLLVVDNRTPEWFVRGTIPGAINVPFHDLSKEYGANDQVIAQSMQAFGVTKRGNSLDFAQARTIIMFCNGMWCSQSSKGIDALLEMGYPAERIKWYRGGMQDWEVLGLTTVTP